VISNIALTQQKSKISPFQNTETAGLIFEESEPAASAEPRPTSEGGQMAR
jgi:hypothetical protein